MKKIIYSMLALMAMTFAACSDVPEPYMNPNNHKGGGDEPAEGVYVEASFNSKIDPFEVITTKGNAWVINYNTATATGFNSSEKTNTESESYLVSPEFDLTESAGAYLEFEYIFRYANRAGEDKVLITANYTDDPTTTEWVDITGTLTEGSDWQTFAKYSSNLPEEFIGEAGVRIALYYSATATDSRTWEVKNLKVMEGQTEEGGGGEITPPEGGEGDGTEPNPYNIVAAKAASGANKWVKGYIVGYINTSGYVYTYSAEGAIASNVIIASSADEKTDANCMPVQLVSGTAIRTGVNLIDNPANIGKEILICGSIENYFSVPGIKAPVYVKVGDNEYGTKPGDTPVDPTPSGIYSIDFTKSQGEWNIVNAVALPTGIEYVWKQDAQYGMKASAYVSGTRYATDSWLVSPALTLSGETTMTFSQAQRYAASGCTDLHIMISSTYAGGDIDVSQWTEITPSQWPTGDDWTFIDCTATLPAGTKYVAFRYTSSTTNAATWEIKTVKID